MWRTKFIYSVVAFDYHSPSSVRRPGAASWAIVLHPKHRSNVSLGEMEVIELPLILYTPYILFLTMLL